MNEEEGDARVEDDLEPDDEPLLRTGQQVGEYTLHERLGRGVAGEVYRATDDAGQVVAMKILRPEQSPERQELRFRRELRAIARLDHPHVLRVLGQGRTDDGARYMVTEFAAGGDLRRMVGQGDNDDLLVILLQVASALDYVHSQRIVHRDLKPENVLCFPGEGGRLVAKLADFGIAWLDPGLARPMTQAGKLMGTVDFISPEQVRGEPADPRSDLYALGVMTYELFAARVPFEGPMWKVLQARVTTPAPSLGLYAPSAPPKLVELVDRLLATDPRDRPQSAHLVCTELAAILATTAAGGAAERVLAGLPAATGAFLYRPPRVGREPEVEALVTAIEHALAPQQRAADDAPVAFALVGEAGLGKTAVTRMIEERLVERGIEHVTHMLAGDATRPPFAPFQAIEHDLAERAGRDGKDPKASDGSWVAARRFIAKEEPEVVVGRFLASDDAAAWRRRRVRRVLEHARAASPIRGFVLVIEDVHEMDGGAWALLRDLLDALRAERRPRPVVLMSARPTARAALDRLAAHGLSTVALSDLDEAAVTSTVAAMLGTGTSALPDGLVGQTLAECRGNPLLVQSYLLALVGAGDLRRVRGGWALGAERRVARLPTQMANVLRARLALLSPTARDVLGVAAAIGVSFETRLLVTAAGRGEDEVLDALDEALRGGIVESTTTVVDSEVLAFTHKRLAEVSYEGLAAERRAACHDVLGQTLLAQGELSPTVLARHFGQGTDDARAIGWLRAAADESLAAHDHASVELHLRRLIARLETTRGVTLAEREALGDALLAQGKCADARAVFEALGDAAADGDPRLVRARWLRKTGLARFLSNDTTGGLLALEAALATLGDRVPRSRLGIRWRVGRDLVAARLRRGSVIVGPPDPRLEERMSCHRWLGTLLRWIDLERVAAHSAAQLRLAERSGDVGARAYAYAVHATFWAFLARPRRAAKVQASARRLAEARHDDGARAFMELMTGATALLGPTPDEASGHFDGAVRLARRAGDRFLEVLTLSGRGWASMLLGRWRQSDEDFAGALATADALDIRWLRADAGVGRSLVQVAMGHHTDGVARARALAEDDTLGLPAIQALAVEILGGAEFIRGRYKEAATLLEDASRRYHAHHLETGWGYLVHIEHCESMLFQVDRDGQSAVPDLIPRLRADLRHAQRVIGKIPIFRGFDDILAGVVASRRGQRDKALALFTRGHARRVGPSESYLDSWLGVRMAVERLRLGGPRIDTQHALDRVGEAFHTNGLRGMLAWLGQMRTELGL